MNTSSKQSQRGRSWLPILCLSAVMAAASAQSAPPPSVGIVPSDAKFRGKSYSQWAASFWQWMMALPLEGHPAIDDPSYVFSAGQSGSVWYWAAPEGFITRNATLPAGKALFLTIRDVETSSVEAVDSGFYGATEAEQRANTKYFANHIVDVFCVIDGVPVQNLQAYRFATAQFTFTAPTPWIFGATGGTGTSVGEGYFLTPTPQSGPHA